MGARFLARIVAAIALLGALLAPSARAQNHSDIWWNPSESGWGLTIADHQSQLFAVWFTYRQDGHPTWYVIPGGTVSADGLHFNGDMYATTGPAFSSAPFDPAKVTVTKVGSASLDFTSDSTANFTYNLAGVSATKAIQRQPFGTAAPDWGNDLTDIWWNPNESGWGITLAQHGNNVFGVWFTYDTDNTPLWVVLPGVTFNGPDAFTGTLFTTTGPYFGNPAFDPSQVVVTPQGSVSATVNREGSLDLNCITPQHVTLNWTFRDAGASETVCEQAFGDMPGTPMAITLADPLPSVPPSLSTPGSFSASAVALLAESVPPVSALVPAMTNAEQAMWTTLLTQLAASTGPGKTGADHGKSATKSNALGSLVAAAVVGAGMGMEGMATLPRGTTMPAHQNESTTDGVTVNGSLGGGRNADGTSHAEFAFTATAPSDNGPVTANSSSEFQGLVCPAADGSLPFSLHVVIGASSGTGAKVTGAHLEFLLTGAASVNDAANIQAVNFTARIQESLQRPESHNAYIDYTVKATMAGDWTSQGTRTTTGISGQMNRMGSTTTAEDRTSMLDESSPIAGVIMAVYLASLQNDWQNGHCVKVIAAAPSTVAPNSTTSVDARVHTKPDDEEIPAPIDSTLDGAVSVQPPHLAKSPGTFVYVAPPQSGQTATIHLKSTSRRGIGELDLSLTTSTQGYAVDWSDGAGNHVWGAICGGLESAFTLNFSSGGTTVTGTLQFAPSSAAAGAVHLTGQGAGGAVAYAGDGTYTVDASAPAIHFSVPQEIAMYPGGAVTVPGPAGNLPLTPTTQCGG